MLVRDHVRGADDPSDLARGAALVVEQVDATYVSSEVGIVAYEPFGVAVGRVAGPFIICLLSWIDGCL